MPISDPEFERTLELWRGYKEVHVHLAKCYAAIGASDPAKPRPSEIGK
jgi:hypothetical protein